MVQFLPRIPTFSEQFSQALGQNLQQGMTNLPELAMKLSAQRRGRREDVLQKAQDIFTGYRKDATPMEVANFLEKIGNVQGSPAEMLKKITEQAQQQQLDTERLKRAHGAGNLSLKGLMGMGKEFLTEGRVLSEQERLQEAKQLAKYVDPEVARSILAGKDFRPEQIEEVVGKQPTSVQGIIDKLPIKNKYVAKKIPKDLTEKNKLTFEQNLRDVLRQDPNVNLVLLRKKYAKKGINWKDFKDALLGMEEQGLQLTNEQRRSFDTLMKPPIDDLGKLLKLYKITKKIRL